MNILVLNCGSSSIKYQLLDMHNNAEVLAIGLAERIGSKEAVLKHKPCACGKDKIEICTPLEDHTDGINLVLKTLVDPNHGVIKSLNEIVAVGHRVVHGGEKFSGSVLITQEIIDQMEECVDLAPLHNPANLKGIYAMKKLLPEVPQCGVFDTAFHQTMPDHAYMYALPYEIYKKYKIRRYGFHGASHRFVSGEAARMVNKNLEDLKIITCHLGNGASIAAVKNGKSIDTSMGLTPIEGLIMGTRVGDLDIGALFYLMNKEDLSITAANDLLNKKSGMLGISGFSSDMRDINDAAEKGNEQSILALKMYGYRIKKYIGAYAAAMGGVDIVVFTGGVGENDYLVRELAVEGLDFMGIKINKEKNYRLRQTQIDISDENASVKTLIVMTNEELVIAQDTLSILES